VPQNVDARRGTPMNGSMKYLVFSAISSSYFSIPRMSSMSCTDNWGLYFSAENRVSIPNTVPQNREFLPAWPESFASAYSTAFARHTEPISLSKFRTPDSLVYDSIILDTTSWLNSTCPSPRPSIPRQQSQNFQGRGVLTCTNLLWN